MHNSGSTNETVRVGWVCAGGVLISNERGSNWCGVVSCQLPCAVAGSAFAADVFRANRIREGWVKQNKNKKSTRIRPEPELCCCALYEEPPKVENQKTTPPNLFADERRRKYPRLSNQNSRKEITQRPKSVAGMKPPSVVSPPLVSCCWEARKWQRAIMCIVVVIKWLIGVRIAAREIRAVGERAESGAAG